MISMGSTVKVTTKKDAKALMAELQAIVKQRVLVGVPEATNEREEGEGIGNAALAAIHDNGSPLQGIPARPFMKPGIAKAQDRINNFLMKAARCFMNNDQTGGQDALMGAGMTAQSSIRNVIMMGAGFAPLKRGTLLGRLRRRKGLYKRFKGHPERAADKEAMLAGFKPLMDTNEMLKSITYVVEEDNQ